MSNKLFQLLDGFQKNLNPDCVVIICQEARHPIYSVKLDEYWCRRWKWMFQFCFGDGWIHNFLNELAEYWRQGWRWRFRFRFGGGWEPLNDDTKILTQTDTETFFTIPNFLKPRLFSEIKFLETETETYFPRPNFPKPKLRLFSGTKFLRNWNRYFSCETKFFRNRNQDFFSETKFLKPKLKPSKIWQKSRDRDLNQDFSTSFEMKFLKFGTYKQNWKFWDQNLGL